MDRPLHEPMKVQLSVDELLPRIAANDREAAVELLSRFGARLRRRIRGKVGASMQRIFDSQDIMATVARRFDQLVMSGHLRVESEAKLWSLLNLLADHAVVDKARQLKRARAAEGVYLTTFSPRDGARTPETITEPKVKVHSCLRLLSKPEDRQFLTGWLRNQRLREVAHRAMMPVDAASRRWNAIKKLLRRKIQARGITRNSLSEDEGGS